MVLQSVKSHYQKVKSFYQRYERLFMPVTLIAGFLLDYLTFTSIQINTTLSLLSIYWIAVGIIILFIPLYDAQKISPKLRYLRLVSPLIIQFSFGSLLGGSLIFYWFSGTIFSGWPIFVILAGLIVANEIFKDHFERPMIQMGVYFFSTFSLLAITLPFLFNSLDSRLFVLSGLISAVIFFLYAKLYSYLASYPKKQTNHLYILFFIIFIIMNALYFTNLIPPVPLSLREAGIYHSIQRSGSSYILQGERESTWQRLIHGHTLHLKQGGSAYVYTSIFAPTDLNTVIIHDWQYYDPNQKKWISKDKLSFVVTGGRQNGFRGYSRKSSLLPGSWRVFAETKRGQILGQVKFTVVRVSEEPELVQIKK